MGEEAGGGSESTSQFSILKIIHLLVVVSITFSISFTPHCHGCNIRNRAQGNSAEHPIASFGLVKPLNY